ncbi:MAG: nucleoside deaminase [Pseudomonadota bacterium]
MERALLNARRAGEMGEVPVGAVVVKNGEVIAEAHNLVYDGQIPDPTGHAEVRALRSAARAIGSPRLDGCDLYVTLEPCAMCAAAIAIARIRRLYFGAADPKGGAVENGPRFFTQPTCHHRPEVFGGIGERAASELLRDFFARMRSS